MKLRIFLTYALFLCSGGFLLHGADGLEKDQENIFLKFNSSEQLVEYCKKSYASRVIPWSKSFEIENSISQFIDELENPHFKDRKARFTLQQDEAFTKSVQTVLAKEGVDGLVRTVAVKFKNPEIPLQKKVCIFLHAHTVTLFNLFGQ